MTDDERKQSFEDQDIDVTLPHILLESCLKLGIMAAILWYKVSPLPAHQISDTGLDKPMVFLCKEASHIYINPAVFSWI